MGRTCDQTDKCLERDLEWLKRIRKRARDNEDRSPEVRAEVLGDLNRLIFRFEKELSVADEASGSLASQPVSRSADQPISPDEMRSRSLRSPKNENSKANGKLVATNGKRKSA